MNSPNPHSAYYALLVLESVVKNCGTPMHDEVFTMDNCKMFTHYLKTRPDQNVRAKILELVQTWAYAFRSSEKYQSIKVCFEFHDFGDLHHLLSIALGLRIP